MPLENDSSNNITKEDKNFEKLENFLKNLNKNSAAEDHIADMKDQLSKIQGRPEFSEELIKFKALGNKIRFSIYKYLEKRDLCACELSVLFNKNEATISHHLKILTEANLIKGTSQGYYVIYEREDIEELDERKEIDETN